MAAKESRHQPTTAKDGVNQGEPKDIPLVGPAHHIGIQILENVDDMSMTHALREIGGYGMVTEAIACGILKGDACFPIVIVAHHKGIDRPDGEGRKENLAPEFLWLVVFPTGVENRGQHKEKQHLANAPQYPFPL